MSKTLLEDIISSIHNAISFLESDNHQGDSLREHGRKMRQVKKESVDAINTYINSLLPERMEIKNPQFTGDYDWRIHAKEGHNAVLDTIQKNREG